MCKQRYHRQTQCLQNKIYIAVVLLLLKHRNIDKQYNDQIYAYNLWNIHLSYRAVPYDHQEFIHIFMSLRSIHR